jgi:RNA polymerase sigma factor (sigma-70 family)
VIRGRRSANLPDIGTLFSEGSLTGLSEAQLLDRFLVHGDEAAFGAILRLHGPMVLGVCRRWLSDPNDVDDAFQATFLVLVERARTLRDRDVLGAWLHRVAHRVAARARNDSRRRRAFEERGTTEQERAREDAPGEAAEAADVQFILDEELARLTERYRRPLILCDLEGRTHEAAAAQLRCPVGTVKSRLSRAREKLRSRLVRRGLSAPPMLAPVTLFPDPNPAVPGALLDAATRAAAGLSPGGAMVGTVAPLMKAATRTHPMILLKLAATALTAAGIVSAAAGVLARTAPEEQPPIPAPAKTEGDPPGLFKPAVTKKNKGFQPPDMPKGAGSQPALGQVNRPEPGTDPRSRALLAKLEEPITMSFPNDTPLEDVLKYIKQATAGPDGDGIPIYVDPVGLLMVEQTMQAPIRMDLSGVPLRRILKLIADQINMGYGVKDGMITLFAPDFQRKNWRELLIVEPGGPFPETTPLQLLVEKAERGEMSDEELDQLNERLKAIEEASRRYHSIKMQKGGYMSPPMPKDGFMSPPMPNVQTKPAQ